MRVLIIGAGIGGVTAAIALARKGIDVEIYERSPRLAEVGAGVSLFPNALKALHQLGLKSRLDAMSFVSAEGALRRADGRVLSRTTASDFVSRFGMAVSVFHRAELLAALVDAAGNIPIHLDHECEAVEQEGDVVTVRFMQNRQARADVLVGADGLHSVVRSHLAIPGELRYSGYTAWRGIAPFTTDGLATGETLGCGQRFGLAPIAGNRVYWYATDNVPRGQQESAASTAQRLRDMFSEWHAPIPALLAATEPPSILRNDIYDRDPSDTWGRGRITLLGDAAHPMTPNLGQGACQAIEDAMVLARRLASIPDAAAALRAYESDRMPRTGMVVRSSRQVGELFQTGSPVLCRARDLVLRMTPAFVTYRSLQTVAGYEGHLDVPPPR